MGKNKRRRWIASLRRAMRKQPPKAQACFGTLGVGEGFAAARVCFSHRARSDAIHPTFVFPIASLRRAMTKTIRAAANLSEEHSISRYACAFGGWFTHRARSDAIHRGEPRKRKLLEDELGNAGPQTWHALFPAVSCFSNSCPTLSARFFQVWMQHDKPADSSCLANSPCA